MGLCAATTIFLAALTAALLPREAEAQATFVIDSLRSGMRVDAEVTTIFGTDADSDSTRLSGTLAIHVDENTIQIVDGVMRFAEGIEFTFRYGTPSLGSIIAETQPDSLYLEVVIPGEAVSLEDGGFSQSGNIMLFEAVLELSGTGIFVSSMPDDPQDVAVGSTETLEGRLEEDSGTIQLELPVRFGGGFELGGGTNGEVFMEGTLYASAPVSAAIDDPDEQPSTLAITDVYPLPVRERAHVALSVPQPEDVRLEIFDLRGRQVARQERKLLSAGRHELPVDTSALSSGLYFVVVTSGTSRETAPMVVVR